MHWPAVIFCETHSRIHQKHSRIHQHPCIFPPHQLCKYTHIYLHIHTYNRNCFYNRETHSRTCWHSCIFPPHPATPSQFPLPPLPFLLLLLLLSQTRQQHSGVWTGESWMRGQGRHRRYGHRVWWSWHQSHWHQRIRLRMLHGRHVQRWNACKGGQPWGQVESCTAFRSVLRWYGWQVYKYMYTYMCVQIYMYSIYMCLQICIYMWYVSYSFLEFVFVAYLVLRESRASFPCLVCCVWVPGVDVYVYVFICVPTYICVYTYMYGHLYIYRYTYIYTYIHMQLYMNIHIHLYVFIYKYIYIYICIYVHIYMYIHIYLYIYI